MVRNRVERLLPRRDALTWAVLYPALIVLPVAAASVVYPMAKFGLVPIGLVAGMAFGFMGEDFRAQSAEESAYHRDVDSFHTDENPDERLGSPGLLLFTGGLASGSLVVFVALLAVA